MSDGVTDFCDNSFLSGLYREKDYSPGFNTQDRMDTIEKAVKGLQSELVALADTGNEHAEVLCGQFRISTARKRLKNAEAHLNRVKERADEAQKRHEKAQKDLEKARSEVRVAKNVAELKRDQ